MYVYIVEVLTDALCRLAKQKVNVIKQSQTKINDWVEGLFRTQIVDVVKQSILSAYFDLVDFI